MRTTILELARRLSREVALPGPIYELGARRAEGQGHRGNVRDLFPGQTFVGCDAEAGPGVDAIQDLHALTLPEGLIGTALLLDTIEHVRDPWKALGEVQRCLAPGGVLIMTSVMYFPIHGHPDDYWRFTPSGFSVLLERFDPIAVAGCGIPKLPHTVVGIASKGPAEPGLRAALSACVEGWRRSGARSWKEVALAAVPPVLLVPAYDVFSGVLRRRERRARRARP